MSHETKWKFEEAEPVALEIYDRIYRRANEACIVGSLRRKAPMVGDIEILYVPAFSEEDDPDDMFGAKDVNLTDREIEAMISEGLLKKRLSSAEKEAYGPKNKLLVHVESGIPVDLFAATRETWFNMLVCRTGPHHSNIRICMEAKKRGLKWNPYGEGFTDLDDGGVWPMSSEREVFDTVGMEYLPPNER